jgi:ABC-type glycerol-3-phosphate transport system permease component
MTITETATPARRTSMASWPSARLISRTMIYVILIALVVVEAFPLVWMLLTSVKNSREVFGTFLPASLDFSNFGRVWVGFNLPRHLLNSAYVTTLTVGIIVAVSTMGGYAFARFEFKGRDAIFYACLGAMMIPGQALLIPMFQFLKNIGLLNNLTGLSISYLGGGTAFALFLMRAFFMSLPKDLGEAARIDGASEFGVFWRVYLPLARPGIATVVIIQSMSTWNEFMYATTFISTPALRTIQPALFQAMGEFSTDYTALSSGLILALIPVVTVYLILQRQFIEGMTAGALKG